MSWCLNRSLLTFSFIGLLFALTDKTFIVGLFFSFSHQCQDSNSGMVILNQLMMNIGMGAQIV